VSARSVRGEPPVPARTPRREALRTLTALARTYPEARCELDFDGPFQLLVAVILSAQCTDVRVNAVTPGLFARYPTPAALAGAQPADVAALILPTGCHRMKAAHLIGTAQRLCDEHAGQVPADLQALIRLPGVGRKTANVVLGIAFGIPGIAVDTHVGRLARRLGWTSAADPVVVERELAALLPESSWIRASELLIWHGRRCCHAHRPACAACPVAAGCPRIGVTATRPGTGAVAGEVGLR